MVATNSSSVHFPRPVSASGVRFAVKLTPHGPDQAVKVLFVVAIQPAGGTCPAVIFTSCG